MATFQQSRQPDQSATLATPLARESPPSGGAALSIRLWRAHETAQAGELSWKSNDPAVCLVLDLIAAAQAEQAEQRVASAPNGRFLVAAFSGMQPAILTARRLQWALLGFAGADRFGGTAAAILVHSTPDLPALEADSSVLLPLEHAAPGQILLTPKTAELLQDLPGLPVQAASGAGLCELLWRASEETSSRSSDEEALSQFIKLNGLEIEAPTPPQELTVRPTDPLPAGTDRGLRTLPHAVGPDAVEPDVVEPDAIESARPDLGLWASRLRGNPRLLIGAACAAAILLVLVAIVAISHKGAAKSAAIAVQPASSTAALLASPDASVAQPSRSQLANPVPLASTATPPGPAKPSEQTQKVRKHEESAQGNPTPSDAAKSQANQPKVAGNNCDLDSNLLPKMLDQAERSREQGNYSAALRQFRAVLACDRNNARARNGLDLTEFSMQHR